MEREQNRLCDVILDLETRLKSVSKDKDAAVADASVQEALLRRRMEEEEVETMGLQSDLMMIKEEMSYSQAEVEKAALKEESAKKKQAMEIQVLIIKEKPNPNSDPNPIQVLINEKLEAEEASEALRRQISLMMQSDNKDTETYEGMVEQLQQIT